MKMNNYFNQVGKWFKGKDHELINKCIICGQPYEGEQKEIAKCSACGFQWRYSQPTQTVLNEFYENSEPMESWANIKTDDAGRQLQKFYYVWEFIKGNNIKSILDVGCGNGYFLNNVDSSRLRIGVEGNDASREHCNYPVYKHKDSLFDSIHAAKEFDMITMFGVLEHLKDPIGELKQYLGLLKKGGVFVAIVPNVKSLVVETLGLECSTFCPQHLWYYDSHSLTCLAKAVGLQVDKFITVESELQPILRKLRGLNPYFDLGFELTDRDLMADKILANGLGYKLIAFMAKE